VLVVKGDRERLIPFLRDQTIVSVDLSQGQIVVDWDPDF
jgi:16S rRNA processing protein RimM